MKQDKQPIYDKLDSLGITYDKRWKVSKLEALIPTEEPSVIEPPTHTEDELQRIALSVSKADEKPIEVVLAEMTVNDLGDVRTPNGVIVPGKALVNLRKSIWEYYFKESADACVVYRMHKLYKEEVRTYSRKRHGDNFKALAQTFINKNNK